MVLSFIVLTLLLLVLPLLLLPLLRRRHLSTCRQLLLLLSCVRRPHARRVSWMRCAAAGSAGCASAGMWSRRLWAAATCTVATACQACLGALFAGRPHLRSGCSADDAAAATVGLTVTTVGTVTSAFFAHISTQLLVPWAAGMHSCPKPA